MAASPWDYRDYKRYLNDVIASRKRGEKSRIAAHLRCHLAYVSQVLNGEAQLSLEQADALNGYLMHSEDESDHFLLLVSHERAGTASLRALYEARIRKALEARSQLENRLKSQKAAPPETQATYYGSWYYTAIHLLVSIPGYQTKEAIARRLQLPLAQVSRALEFLVGAGLVELQKGVYRTGQVTLHLSKGSPWASRQHSEWRLRAIQSLEHEDPAHLHYSSVVSMSEDDLPAVRKILVDAIEKVRAVVRDSPEKQVYCYTLDLFSP